MTDIRFGPTANGKWYLCLAYHRCNRPTQHKRCWAISRPREYGVFEWADESDSYDDDLNLWGFLLIQQELGVLGTEGERIAKFPATSNATDDWHGYPVHANDRPERRPPPRFIEGLYERRLLSKVQKKRIQDSRI